MTRQGYRALTVTAPVTEVVDDKSQPAFLTALGSDGRKMPLGQTRSVDPKTWGWVFPVLQAERESVAREDVIKRRRHGQIARRSRRVVRNAGWGWLTMTMFSVNVGREERQHHGQRDQ